MMKLDNTVRDIKPFHAEASRDTQASWAAVLAGGATPRPVCSLFPMAVRCCLLPVVMPCTIASRSLPWDSTRLSCSLRAMMEVALPNRLASTMLQPAASTMKLNNARCTCQLPLPSNHCTFGLTWIGGASGGIPWP
ncbi:hypothetical protein SKAU_G00309840 [Synaphobranchus kaupii]|uniref:Uncharacterized protein n=1 Tax=Synaphobranchus kaupii TaxID=118154 RepID=A0A9Q1ERF7_SYNKA|nr:hypothetical protein SKAU_G00309840 [Synaphobranchus kaupii]